MFSALSLSGNAITVSIEGMVLVNQHLSVHPNLVPPAIPRLKRLQLQLRPGEDPISSPRKKDK